MLKQIMSMLPFLLSPWLLAGQEPAYQRYLPHPLDSLANYPLDSLVVSLHGRANGGEPEPQGLPLATYRWDSQGRIRAAVSWQLEDERLQAIDSVVWTYRADTTFRQAYERFSEDPDDRPYVDLGSPESWDRLSFEATRTKGTDTLIMAHDRVVGKRDGYTQSHYRYDSTGNLLELEVVNPQRAARGMGGHTWERYHYNHAGQLIERWDITTGRNQSRDTTIHTFQYDDLGQLISQTSPSAIMRGTSSLRQYEYEDGQLMRASTRRTTFRSSGPPDYDREEIIIHFETTYRYAEGRLIETKQTRDGEPEPQGWLKYEYQDRGLLKRKIEMDVAQGEPYLIYTYDYYFGQ
jgi:hypothetical protein